MELHPNNHHHHLQQQQQQQQQPPPPAAPHKPPAEHDLKRRPLVPLSFSNGSLKKHRPFYPPPPPHHNHAVYRECMKNHAASLGGHALDGCGEFMPSPDASPAHPASLTCAACGCHRNFHRRLLHAAPDHLHPHPLPLPLPPEREAPDDAAADDDDGDEAVDDDDAPEDAAACGSPPPPTASAGHQYYSAPHMLMALSAGIPGGPSGSSPASATPVAGGASPAVGVGSLQLPRKRFRSKFSPLQKDRMQELSERLGWRMQRRDEALVEDCCREIGVSRAVFKVWMHNNKHNFVGGPSSRRAASGGGAPAAAGGVGGGGEATSSSGGVIGTAAAGVNGVSERNGVNGDDQNGGGGEHALNSSSPSSS